MTSCFVARLKLDNHDLEVVQVTDPLSHDTVCLLHDACGCMGIYSMFVVCLLVLHVET